MTRNIRYEFELRRLCTPRVTVAAEAFALPCERAMLEILDRAPRTGETLAAVFRTKERELGELFATLTVIEARSLHRRLTLPRPDDGLAARFGRFVLERRLRLLGFLADARRREALQVKVRP